MAARKEMEDDKDEVEAPPIPQSSLAEDSKNFTSANPGRRMTSRLCLETKTKRQIRD
jgi:hypothetical protein